MAPSLMFSGMSLPQTGREPPVVEPVQNGFSAGASERAEALASRQAAVPALRWRLFDVVIRRSKKKPKAISMGGSTDFSPIW